MKSKARRPLSKSEWLLFLAPLGLLLALGLYAYLRPLFPRVLGGHRGSIGRLRFSPDGSKLAVVSSELKGFTYVSEIHLWDLSSRSRLWSDRVNDLVSWPSFSPDGKTVFFPRDGGKSKVTLRDTQTGNALRVVSGFYSGRFVGQNEIVLQNSRVLQLQNAMSGIVLQTFQRNMLFYPFASQWSHSPSKRVLIGLDGDPALKSRNSLPILWDIQTGKKLRELPKRKWTTVQFVDDETAILSEREKETFPFPNSLQLWDWKRGRRLRELVSGATGGFRLSHDGRSLIFLQSLSYYEKDEIKYNGCKIKLLSIPDGKVQWSLKTGNEIQDFVGDLDLRFLLTHETGAKIPGGSLTVLRDGKTGQVLTEFNDITTVMISPDGKTIATGDAKGNVRLYDTQRFLN